MTHISNGDVLDTALDFTFTSLPPQRYWLYRRQLEMMPWLPERLTIDEVKDHGMVNLEHVDPTQHTTPWIPAGWYKLLKGGKLYVVERRACVKGSMGTVWLYRPIVRIEAR